MNGFRRVESTVPASDRFGGGQGRKAAPMVEFVKRETPWGLQYVRSADLRNAIEVLVPASIIPEWTVFEQDSQNS